MAARYYADLLNRSTLNYYRSTSYTHAGNGIHLGTVLNGAGDPLTPGWPSVQGAHRLRSHDDNGRLLLSELPSIPVHPISYNDARTILKCLGGQNSPYGWAGKLTGVEYKLGGVFKPPSAGNGALNVQNARVTVNNDLVRAKVANVVGVIKGYVEPDRYVVVGAHRDSWSFGAVDPGTATAALVMTARSFAKTMTDYGIYYIRFTSNTEASKILY